MILPRKEFASMITFMLPVIPTEAKTGRNCLFVKIDEGKCIFTAGSEHVMKRVIMLGQTEMTELAGCRKKKRKTPDSFMIQRGAVKAFAETLKDHKAICKKLAKNDETHLFIEVDDEEMESIGEYVHFKQPGFQFKEYSSFFEQNQESVSESLIMSGDIENVMTGFSKSNPVEASYRTMNIDKKTAKLIHFKQESTEYEAVFICPSEEIKEQKDEEKF